MKWLKTIIVPMVLLGVFVYFLTDLKHVKRLNAEERLIIERFQKEQGSGAQLRIKGVFSENEYTALTKSLFRLRNGVKNKCFGRKWGTKLDNPKEEFKQIRNIMIKKEYPQKQKEFFAALKLDLDQAEKHYGTRASHDILSDLSYYVFQKENEKKERQYGNPKTLYVMKKMGIKVA